jgi:hypothetical protein
MRRDSSDLEAKTMIRTLALELSAKPALVLDLFAGEGRMHQAVWHAADRYLGIDRRYSRARDDGLCWQGDNRVLLAPAMAEASWNIFDLDAYDNPWPLGRRLIGTMSCPEFTMTITCGIGRGLRNGKTNGYVRRTSGTKGLSDTRLLHRWYDDVVRWIVTDYVAVRAFEVRAMKRIFSRSNPQVCYWLLKGAFI